MNQDERPACGGPEGTSSDAHAGIKSVQIEAIVIRANGKREDLGTISMWHSNPFKRYAFSVSQWFKKSLAKFKELTEKKT